MCAIKKIKCCALVKKTPLRSSANTEKLKTMLAGFQPSEDERIVTQFAELCHRSQRVNAFFDTRNDAFNCHIKNMALLLSPFLPENRSEYKHHNPLYRRHREIIKQTLLTYVEDAEKRHVLLLVDHKVISTLSPENIKCRKRFSDAVSSIMRKIQSYVYFPETHHKKCILCQMDILKLILTCERCKCCFHYHCLTQYELRCTYCGLEFVETEIVETSTLIPT